MHPMLYGIHPDRNFDVIFDEEVAKQSSPQPNTVDVVLDHEIIGHIVQVLDDPTWKKRSEEDIERYSRERENEYRQHNGMGADPSARRHSGLKSTG
jgi:ATP adenylyltransferase/5',5'''-P-1,P-4-tetraphosphate phosphorylase II